MVAVVVVVVVLVVVVVIAAVVVGQRARISISAMHVSRCMHPWSTVRLTVLVRTMARHAGHGFEDIADEDMATQRRSPYASESAGAYARPCPLS